MSAWSDWEVADLQGFRQALSKAIASGAERVRYADRDVTYRSLDEMRQTLTMIDDEINSRAGTTRVRRYRVESRKGFAS